jgi:predicted RNase H-like HicB family nuclease
LAALAPETYIPITVVVRGRHIHLRLHFDEGGGFWVDASNMRGLVTQGDTVEEAVANGVDAALALIESEKLPRRKSPR